MIEDDILITEELLLRSPRLPNLEAENQSLRDLGRQLTQPTQKLLKHFTKIAKDLCKAGTAGISLIEKTPSGEEMFRWVALAGAYEGFEGGTIPCDFSPCGVCLKQGEAQLYSYPARYFTSLQQAEPVIVEELVVPLVLEEQAVGTIWITSHDEQRKFDREDLRVLSSLADFLVAALGNIQMCQAVKDNLRREQAARAEAEVAKRQVDITEPEEAEQALHQTEERFRQMADMSNAVFWLADAKEQRILYISPSYERIWGRDHKRLYTHYNEFLESIHPEDRERVKSAPSRCVLQEQFEIEYRVVRPEGSVCWVRDRGFLIRDKNRVPERIAGFAEDITERKYAELLLNEQKKLLELIASGKSMDECLFSVCTSVTKLDPNVRACILLTDDQRRKFCHSITPNFPPSFGQGLKDAPINELAIGTGGEAVYCANPVSCADIANDTRWSQGWRDLCVVHDVLACYSAPILDMDNLPLGSLMLCFDEARRPTDWEHQLAEFGTKIASIVFERERSSQARRESEEKYYTLFHSMGEAFAFCEIILDDDGKPFDARMLEVNPAHETMTGLTTEETVGNTIRRLIPDIDHELFKIYERVALGGETIRFENYISSLSRWFDIYAYKVGKNNDGKFALIYSDITARKQAEKALRDSEELKQRILESSNDCIKVLSLNSEILYISRGGLCLLEINDSKSVLNTNWITYWKDEEQDKAKAAIATATAGNIGQFQGWCPTMKGTLKWWDSIITPVRDASGQVTQLVVISRDITLQKQVEIQQQQQARELTQLNDSLMRTSELLAERNQELNNFTHIVSHDLKAPLRAIINLSQWIEDDLKGQLDENNQRQMKLLQNRVERMETMIDGLLAYSRVGRTEVETQSVDVGELLNEILDSLAPPPTFIIKICSELPTIVAKRLLLSQVFSNLISNAIKHHPRPDGKLEISTTQKGQFYEFAIADNGNGIAPENHEKIFDIFQTLNSRDVKESTGVGLSIVKKIVETEGGEITVSSELGRGATFRFTWPKHPLIHQGNEPSFA